ncbi:MULTISPECIES: hypothetical protein [unclassified Aeromicrobium]|uniref:hypothetical protein n=1 Tax=unclassified Aeromicrobium TaxID=2633570 RepID=UPI00396B1843
MTSVFRQWTIEAHDIERDVDAEVRRLQSPDDPFVVLRDPEGNEFCILRDPR